MVAADLGLYVLDVSESIFKYHFSQVVGPVSNSWSYYTDRIGFINSRHQRRVACFQIPYPYNDSIEKEIDAVYDSADTIIVLCSELHARTIDFIRRHDRPKMCWFICGAFNQHLSYSRVYKFMDWFISTVHFYKNIRPSTLYTLNPYEVKPYHYEALLGRMKPHRTQAYEFLQRNNMMSHGIVTYVNDHKINFATNDQSEWIWELDGLENHRNVEWTVDRIKYYGHNMSLSQVMPLEVYNSSAYSLVCETNFESDYVFYTEKTVKPILARRLFVMLSHQYALARLRDMGFKTFHGIIDESYDDIEPAIHRHDAALEQLQWLCAQEQSTILNKCQDIVDHNFNLMYGYNWQGEYLRQLGNALLGVNQ